ncbi:hypothetical protein JTB14_009867 [Gonioctena quinquepunctata]|nr:hypothetical protein JTB14_009867 [Gonioctena quinquepunctata]
MVQQHPHHHPPPCIRGNFPHPGPGVPAVCPGGQARPPGPCPGRGQLRQILAAHAPPQTPWILVPPPNISSNIRLKVFFSSTPRVCIWVLGLLQ